MYLTTNHLHRLRHDAFTGDSLTPSLENLTRFFDAFISLSFWQRIFGWKKVSSLSYLAYEESRELFRSLSATATDLQRANQSITSLQVEVDQAKTMRATVETELRSTLSRQTAEISQLNERIDRLNRHNSSLEKEQAAMKQDEASRRSGHEKAIATLETIQHRVADERREERETAERFRMQRLTEMKEKWSRHEKEVQSLLRTLCRRHSIEYVEAVPFKGSPDNTVQIAGEYVVFDAKSPAGDDLRNFPVYIKSQTEAVRKYADQEGVRKEVFLVVPSDTAESIGQYSFNLADYSVYVVTPNALEPILLSLKRIEDYEFVNQLSPEEQENICRLLGKFAHVVKRRIQVDHFFAWEFLDVLTRCESGLPREFVERIMEFEKSEKLNPPQERRSKQIPTRDLEEDTRKLQRETSLRAVEIPPSLQDQSLGLPLFEKKE